MVKRNRGVYATVCMLAVLCLAITPTTGHAENYLGIYGSISAADSMGY